MGASCAPAEVPIAQSGCEEDNHVRSELIDDAAPSKAVAHASKESSSADIEKAASDMPAVESKLDQVFQVSTLVSSPNPQEPPTLDQAAVPAVAGEADSPTLQDGSFSKEKPKPKGKAKATAKAKSAAQRKKLEQSAKDLEKMMLDMKAENKAGHGRMGITMTYEPPVRMGDEYMMTQRGHGTCSTPVQKDLRWGCEFELADDICCFNRKGAEDQGYLETTSFLEEMRNAGEGPVTFHDSVSGRVLFTVPKKRTMKEFLDESIEHGWPSFRDAEVNWLNVRVLADGGECVSCFGTHLGHCFKDHTGKSPHRYCINLVSVAGQPPAASNSDSIIVKGLK
jgi:peptide methionine sulfoxide reductase MsrB